MQVTRNVVLARRIRCLWTHRVECHVDYDRSPGQYQIVGDDPSGYRKIRAVFLVYCPRLIRQKEVTWSPRGKTPGGWFDMNRRGRTVDSGRSAACRTAGLGWACLAMAQRLVGWCGWLHFVLSAWRSLAWRPVAGFRRLARFMRHWLLRFAALRPVLQLLVVLAAWARGCMVCRQLLVVILIAPGSRVFPGRRGPRAYLSCSLNFLSCFAGPGCWY